MDTSPPELDAVGGKEEYLSRRERRLKMRMQGPSSPGMSPTMRRWLLWGGGFAVLLLVGWGMVRLSSNVVVPAGDGVTLSDPITDKDHSMGPRDARVTLLEYSDFQCPACAAFHPLVKKVLTEPNIIDKVRFVYRSFPLTAIHPNSNLAAQAAEAASMQGKFWEMHDALFQSQSSWSGLSSVGARAAFVSYAKNIGIDMTAFSSNIDSAASKDRVREQSASAGRSGVHSTPTFYINGKKMAQPSTYEEFRKTILDAVNANP